MSFAILAGRNKPDEVIMALLTMLLFSDSRSSVLSFAQDAKVVAVLIFSLYGIFNKQFFRTGLSAVSLNFLPFLVYGLLATLWSDIPFTAFQKSLSYALVFLLVPSVSSYCFREVPRFRVDLSIYFTIVLLVGVALYFVLPDFVIFVGRFRGLLGNPNGLGLYLLLSTAVTLSLYAKYDHRFSKGVYTMFMVLFFISLIACGSRTALMAVLFYVVFSRFTAVPHFLVLLMFFAMILSYEYVLQELPKWIIQLNLQDYLRLDTLSEGSGRFIAWNFAWQNINDVYFLGGGFGYTDKIYQDAYRQLSLLGHQGNAHNSYLTLWLDTGVIGLSLFAMGLIRNITQATARYRFALVLLMSVLLSTYFESWLAASLNPFTSLFLILLTVLIEVPEEDEAPLKPV
ncbi:MAG: hypothetical protein Kow0075_08240 [Salibacteraceae bacterium]